MVTAVHREVDQQGAANATLPQSGEKEKIAWFYYNNYSWMDLQIEPFIKVIFSFTLFTHYNISPEAVTAAWNRSHTPHQAHGFYPSVRSPKTEIICNCKEEPDVNLSFHLQNF